ncbi:uncharacterized protein LOC135140158 isoform X2 [Zophobas morio]|uniref:uncharacterized protein LOC135140158 isoform X2 n=1 Tax=Zophobas morio TaxID=2755281 RepID=UPI00308274FD
MESHSSTIVPIQNDDENIQTLRFDEAHVDHDRHLDHREGAVNPQNPNNAESEESNLQTMWKLWWPPSFGLIIISCIQLFFFLIDEIIKNVDSTNSATGPIAKLFTYDPMKRYEFWRYLTYMFVHKESGCRFPGRSHSLSGGGQRRCLVHYHCLYPCHNHELEENALSKNATHNVR